MINEFPEEILGKKCIARFGNTFPLLIKFIDARLPLSVQVHPNDDLANKRHNCNGKNEMWYILDADPDAELILGFNQNMDPERYAKLLAEDRIEEVLHREKVNAGDVINVPAGLIHAIGGGVLLAEIQQSSDVTYRVYDFNRIDAKTGKKRDLHTLEAIDALDFSAKTTHKIHYKKQDNQPVSLVSSPYFTTQLIQLKAGNACENNTMDSFCVLMCVEGNVVLEYAQQAFSIGLGQCLFLPAILGNYRLQGEGIMLSVTV